MCMAKNGCGQSGHRTLKLTVFQEWIDGMNWFFTCWSKLRKTKSCFNNFWVPVVKNWCGRLVHGTPKSAISYECIYQLNWFFACLLWYNNFWLDQHRTLYLWLSNVSLLQLYVLVPAPSVAGRVLWNKIFPFFHPAICPGVFLELDR